MNNGSSALETLRNRLHVSNSQVNLYQTCSLKYYFRYVQRAKTEHRSIDFIFGKAIHVALVGYFLGYQRDGIGESLKHLEELFEIYLVTELAPDNKPKVLFSKTIPDLDTAMVMGKSMLKAFTKYVNLDGYEVIAIEKPFSVPL